MRRSVRAGGSRLDCHRYARRGEGTRLHGGDVRSADLELLFVDWLNTIIYEMAVRSILFAHFAVSIEDTRLGDCRFRSDGQARCP